VAEDLPFVRRDFFAVDGDDDALAAEAFAPAVMSSGVARALELMLTLSAPAQSMACMSATSRLPPPTVSGMKHFAAVRSITSIMVPRPVGAGGDIEENISSAPWSLYRTANSTGSPTFPTRLPRHDRIARPA